MRALPYRRVRPPIIQIELCQMKCFEKGPEPLRDQNFSPVSLSNMSA